MLSSALPTNTSLCCKLGSVRYNRIQAWHYAYSYIYQYGFSCKKWSILLVSTHTAIKVSPRITGIHHHGIPDNTSDITYRLRA